MCPWAPRCDMIPEIVFLLYNQGTDSPWTSELVTVHTWCFTRCLLVLKLLLTDRGTLSKLFFLSEPKSFLLKLRRWVQWTLRSLPILAFYVSEIQPHTVILLTVPWLQPDPACLDLLGFDPLCLDLKQVWAEIVGKGPDSKDFRLFFFFTQLCHYRWKQP